MLHHAMGCEFKPWWWQTLFRTQAKHLRFLHVSIWFILFKTIICHLNCVTENWKWNLFLKSISFTSMWPTVELTPDTRPWLSCRQRRRGFSRSLLASIVLRLKGGSQSYQNAHFLKKWANPSLLFVHFRSFFKQIIQFLQQINVKMSIQYIALGPLKHEPPLDQGSRSFGSVKKST